MASFIKNLEWRRAVKKFGTEYVIFLFLWYFCDTQRLFVRIDTSKPYQSRSFTYLIHFYAKLSFITRSHSCYMCDPPMRVSNYPANLLLLQSSSHCILFDLISVVITCSCNCLLSVTQVTLIRIFFPQPLTHPPHFSVEVPHRMSPWSSRLQPMLLPALASNRTRYVSHWLDFGSTWLTIPFFTGCRCYGRGNQEGAPPSGMEPTSSAPVLSFACLLCSHWHSYSCW